MRPTPYRSRTFAVGALGLLLAAPLHAEGQDGPTLVVLVRHAERAGPSADDPGLTEVGAERATELARLLADAGITAIHSSDTRRTRETAAPLADRIGANVEIYDHRDLEGIAGRLLERPGRHLVVGHSNTTDELAHLLGGERQGEIVEEWEYDRLYFLTPGRDGGMTTVMIRFGPPVHMPSATGNTLDTDR
jgi:2,3-bisphosphoglycerate-dependent phosphoglycerate mutase